MSGLHGSSGPPSQDHGADDHARQPAKARLQNGHSDGVEPTAARSEQQPAHKPDHKVAAAEPHQRHEPLPEELGAVPRPDRERPRRAKPASGGSAHEPAQMLDLCELPETYGKDEVGILTKDPQWYFVYWEVTGGGEATAREQLGPSGAGARLVLRLFTTLTTAPAGAAAGHAGRETRELRDVPLPHHHGRKYLEAPRPGALVRAAVGLLSVEGYFAPIAHSALVRMPPQQAAAQTSVEWLHVLPPRSQGHKRERIVAVAPPVPHEEQARPANPQSPASHEAEQAAQFPPAEPTPPGSEPTIASSEPAQLRTETEAPQALPLGNGSGGLG